MTASGVEVPAVRPTVAARSVHDALSRGVRLSSACSREKSAGGSSGPRRTTAAWAQVYIVEALVARLSRRESAVKHIDLNTQGEAVKQFFLSLPVDPEGSVLELNGQAVARVTLLKGQRDGSSEATGPWTEAKNARRRALIDREIDATLTREEAKELQVLQQQMLRERRRLAPVPLDDLRRLHQELLMKAQKQADQGRS
jgi:hypothetical protein